MSGQPLIEIAGDLTVHRAAELLPVLIDALRTGSMVCLDMSAAERIDTAGVQLLLVLRREAAAHGVNLRLAGLRPELREVVDFYGLQDVVMAEV